MRPFLRLEAVVSRDRNEALMAVTDALGASGGWIVDHSLFSDVMAVVRFSLPGDRIAVFLQALTEAGMGTDAPAAMPGVASGEETAGQITLTFLRGTGDLRRTVPAFQ